LRAVAGELPSAPESNRHWFLTTEYTMICIRSGPTFAMGSPSYELGRFADESLHRVEIPRDFAIATTETTAQQFNIYLNERPQVKAKHDHEIEARFSRPQALTPELDCPAVAVTWYEAAQYCNWLSHREGLPESEWCFPDAEAFESGLQLPPDYLHRSGYRLLTEAEWEFAARAGTTTARFFGLSRDLLSEYAWSTESSRNARTLPVACLKPNDLGLFDMLGNAWEWCLDRRQSYPTEPDTLVIDQEDRRLVVDDSTARTRRGGSFTYDAASVRSACRGDVSYFPMQRRDSVGFRIARTLPHA
jgi:formylglycine-generating enzyme required for sulfatase activity